MRCKKSQKKFLDKANFDKTMQQK